MSQYWNWLKKQKEGIGIGALVGLGAFFFYFYALKAQLQSVIMLSVDNPSVFDTIAKPFTAMPTVQLATIKVAIGFIIICAIIGMALDALIAPNK